MKALTICQPYAHLIATGDKRVENRSWPTRYRGPLLIHAGKSRSWLCLDEGSNIDEEYGIPVADMAFGAIVATARLVDCLPLDGIMRGQYSGLYPWLASHEHTEGPWCWVLADEVSLAEPVPARGAQGLWDFPWPPGA